MEELNWGKNEGMMSRKTILIYFQATLMLQAFIIRFVLSHETDQSGKNEAIENLSRVSRWTLIME